MPGFLVCETQNDVDAFIGALTSLPDFNGSLLLRGIERSLQLDFSEAVRLFCAWVAYGQGYPAESAYVGLLPGRRMREFFNYPAFEIESSEEPRQSQDRFQALADMMSAYISTQGNDALRFALVDALGLAASTSAQTSSDRECALRVVERAIASRPQSEALIEAKNALVSGRIPKLVGTAIKVDAVAPPGKLPGNSGCGAPERRLRLLIVGTGRDGTLSIAQMVQELYDSEGEGRRVMHEYCAREFYDAFCSFKETGDEKYVDEIRHMIKKCDFDCIVGNGYAAILPLFAEICGTDLRIVHLRREDKEKCIKSLAKNADLFPLAYGYYSSNPAASTKRMTAFHFDEMTRNEWDMLSATEKFSWYYDKTHTLIGSYQEVSGDHSEIVTEEIDGETTRRKIAQLVSGDASRMPSSVRLNAHRFDVSDFEKNRQPKMQWLLGRLNLERLAHDDVYAVEYFLEKFVTWTGYQITDEINAISPADTRKPAEIDEALSRVDVLLKKGLGEINALRAMRRK